MAAPEQKKALKDWFDKDAAPAMSLQFGSVYKKFNKRKFCQLALADIDEMKGTTIRALYAGLHKVELQVNGYRVGETGFRLRVPAKI